MTLATPPAPRVLRLSDLPKELQWKLDPWTPIRDGLVWTHDQKDKFEPFKRMPPKPHFVPFIRDFQSGKDRMLIHKSRQMMMSWLFVYLLYHDAVQHTGRLNVFQSEEFSKSNELLDRAQLMHERMDPAFWGGSKPAFTRTRTKPAKLVFPDLDSTLMALPEGKNQLRQYAVSGVLMDEAAFWKDLLGTYASSIPAATEALDSVDNEKLGVQRGGRVIVLSSGIQNTDFHRMCLDREEMAHGE